MAVNSTRALDQKSKLDRKSKKARDVRGPSSRSGSLCLDRLELILWFVDGAIAAQQSRQVLGKGGARHYGIAARLNRLALQLALDMRQEADDRRAALELGLDLGN